MTVPSISQLQTVISPFWHTNDKSDYRYKKKVTPSEGSPQSPKKRASGGAGLVTGEELFAMGDIGRTELVKGRIIHLMPTGHRHGYYEGNFTIELGIFVRQHKLGRVLSGEVGVYTARDPDTVRGADVIFISNERLAQAKPKGFLDVTPELVVEVKSPADSWPEIQKKLAEYFAIGVDMVWVADPRYQRVHVYRSLSDVAVLTADDELTGGEVLPGFGVSVAGLFE